MANRSDYPDYPEGDNGTGWFIGIIVALALLAIGYLVFAANSAKASDLAGIEKGTYMLYSDGVPGCSMQAVERDDSIFLLTANHCVRAAGAKTEYSLHLIAFDESIFDKKIGEDVHYLEVVKRDPATDVAVLRPLDKDATFATVDIATADEAKAALFNGADVLAAGYPSTMAAPIGSLVFTDGHYVGLNRSFVPTVTAPMYRTTVSVHYGNSGGGLYAEVGDTWKLVGVTSQLDPERFWANSLFATIESIEKALRWQPKPATDK